MALERVAGLVGQVAQAAADDIAALDRKKQDRLTGAAGQVVGFNAAGEPAAQGTESLRGPKGDTGTRGSCFHWGTAISGTDTTASVFSGSGIASALVGDLYLNTSNWNVYQCTTAGAASTAKWVYKGNIRGAVGDKGSTGTAGAAAGFGTPTAAVDANVGTPSVTVTATGPDTAKVFSFMFKNLKGATGAQGPAGAKGATGATGAKGATGTRGSLLYWGTAITGTNTTASVFSGSGIASALVNDLYLNTSSWNVYQCTTAGAASAAKWAYKGNIKGSKGDKGDKGDTGATGPRGPAGSNASVTVDASISTTSTNPVQNKAVKAELDKKVTGSGLTFSVVNGILTVTY